MPVPVAEVELDLLDDFLVQLLRVRRLQQIVSDLRALYQFVLPFQNDQMLKVEKSLQLGCAKLGNSVFGVFWRKCSHTFTT